MAAFYALYIMKKIALIYMGGTFGCIGEPLSPMPKIDFEPQLQRVLPQHVQMDFFTAPTVKDSSACTAQDWFLLIQQIQSLQLKHYQHFIIIHGTDTLSYAAATLSQFLQRSTHLILTGSQYPLLNVEGNDLRVFTDALDNLNTAIDTITKVPLGVYVAFHHKVMHAHSVHKMHTTALDAFHGITYQQQNTQPEHNSVLIQNQDIEKIKQLNLITWVMQPIELNNVSAQFEQLLNHAPDVLILHGYGTGNIAVNDDIIEKLIQIQKQNCAVILDTQVPFGGLDQRYAISQWVKQANILINNTQSHADLYAKILKMYLQYPSADQWHDHWYEHSK